jgi:hypothetical protein
MKDWYKGFTIEPVKKWPDESVAPHTIGYKGIGLRGVVLEARTQRELKQQIDVHLAAKSGKAAV